MLRKTASWMGLPWVLLNPCLLLAGESTLLFRLVAGAGAPVTPVESPAAGFAGRGGLARMLLEAGVCDDWHAEGHRIADEYDSPRVAKLLARAEADANARLERGETPLMQAAHQGFDDALEMLLARGANVNLRDDRGRTALMHAAKAGNLEAIVLLISRGADPKLKDAKGITAREMAKSEVALDLLQGL